MSGTRTTDDLAFEAMELIRRKNINFSLKTGGRRWACKFSPRDEYEKSRTNSSPSIASTSSCSSSISTPEVKSATIAAH